MVSYRLLVAMMVLFLYSVVHATPVRVADWTWTDQSGIFHEYNVYAMSGLSWNDAAATIQNAWHLATIVSSEEQDMLITGLQGISGEFWIGGYQSATSVAPADGWAWSSGEQWDFNNWAPGEPNDYYGQGSEQYLAVWSYWGADKWLWNDEGSSLNISGFIAERTSAVPEPGIVSLLACSCLGLIFFVRKRKT